MYELNLHFIAFRIGCSTRRVGCNPRMFLFRTHPKNFIFKSFYAHSASIKVLMVRFSSINLAACKCRCLGAAPNLEEAMTYDILIIMAMPDGSPLNSGGFSC